MNVKTYWYGRIDEIRNSGNNLTLITIDLLIEIFCFLIEWRFPDE
jgi:hypothetical protein